MRITVLGCGRWGSFLAWYAGKNGHQACLWGREGSESLAELRESRANEYLQLPRNVALTASLPEAMGGAELVLIAIGAQHLREFARQLSPYVCPEKAFVLCMKGLEARTGKRLTQVFTEATGASANLAIWAGPGHVQDFIRGIPNCMVIGSQSIELTRRLVEALGSELIRFYYGQDLIGNELGAAAKNVIGIAAGMLDGLGYTSLKGALMARGAREIARLVRAMGGNELTVYGLSHLGDYEATLFSPHSHNRRYGEAWVRQEPFAKLAEGVATIRALRMLSEHHEVDLPICNALYQVLNEGENPRESLLTLFLRPVKFEF